MSGDARDWPLPRGGREGEGAGEGGGAGTGPADKAPQSSGGDPDPARLHEDFNAVWGNPRGWRAVTIVNHTAIGLRFMLTGLGFFLFGGLLAMLIRTQLALPGHTIMTPEVYAQVFTMHGTVMMFLFAVPMMEGLAVYLLPKMLGARDLVFPRLSALGYWCYLFGGLILCASLFLGIAPDAGWFMYTPLASATYTPGPNSDFWLIGVTFVEISAVSAGVELAVSILRARAPGMALDKMPLYAWYILTMAMMIVIGFPPLILGSILLELERAAGMPFFDPTRGGDPILWQHLFWLFGHPEVYIIFLPAAGIVSTLLPVFARRPVVGYAWVVVAVLTTGFISFGLWVHHMFAVGIPMLAQAFFSAASMLVAIPTAIQVFSWIATLWLGRPVFHLPMLWLTGFLVIFVAGGLTGVMLALVPFDWQVHDTHFVVAHMHYVLVGGMFFPLIAGLYYWLPHFSGRMASPALGRWGFWLVFGGFNLNFLVMHWTGLLGMPRRVNTYEAGLGWDLPNLISSIGGFVMAAGVVTVLADILLHFRFGRPAPDNPWQADTLEWATALPPNPYNFISLPRVEGRHPLWDQPGIGRELAAGRGGLAVIDHGRRETWGTDPASGEVREIIHLPGNTALPFLAALALAVVCIALLAKAYGVALAAAVVVAGLLLRWSWENGAHPAAAPDARTAPGDPPLHSRTADGPGLWGMALTLLADGALYLALLFGWFYLWTVGPTWEVPEGGGMAGRAGRLLLAAAVAHTLAQFAMQRCARRMAQGRGPKHGAAAFAAVAAGGALALGLVYAALRAAGLVVTATAHDAVIAVVLGYSLVHLGMATVVTLLQALRVRRGYVGLEAPYEPLVVARLWHYNGGVLWSSYAALVLFPPAWGGI
ncbi:cytochrome c oxidase subunit I [Azoarcus indigens]|uniref:cytochrome-c oxidase n=1 Tax=Azoarcus indigens TaxID=29545 RepID=A0A4R6EEJ6_9RHOO|nr:cytochrome c oxidase subunit I [Azoarcus indigens]NMG65942.1 cytochrome c oxidase subunit I [Azoarcus indigens]TDN55909.1 cytochrome c oxidase subunit I+III [Azoarcus indigens]